MSIKIAYRVEQILTFKGTIEVDEDTYEAMKNAHEDDDDDILGDLILDNIDARDPQNWRIDSVDEFKKVED